MNLHTYFDKVIVLTREDDIAGAESHMLGLISRKWGGAIITHIFNDLVLSYLLFQEPCRKIFHFKDYSELA